MKQRGRAWRTVWAVALGATIGLLPVKEAAAEDGDPATCRSSADCPEGYACSDGICIDSPWNTGAASSSEVPAPPGFGAHPPGATAPGSPPGSAATDGLPAPPEMLEGAGMTLSAPSSGPEAAAILTMPEYNQAQALRLAGILLMVAGTVTVEVGALFGLFGSYVPSLAVTSVALVVNGLGAGLLTAGIWRLRRLIEDTGAPERRLGLFIVSWIFTGATGLFNAWGIVADALLSTGAISDQSSAIIPLVLGLITSAAALVLLPIDYTYTRRHLQRVRPARADRGARGTWGLAIVPLLAPTDGGGIVGVAGFWGGPS